MVTVGKAVKEGRRRSLADQSVGITPEVLQKMF